MVTEDTSESLPTIVVAGDVCIDWLSIHVEPVTRDDDKNPEPANWQLRGGRNRYSHRGGAWLTAEFTEHAVKGQAVVRKPAQTANDLSSDDIIHSMLTLNKFPRVRNKVAVDVWGVSQTEGFAWPWNGELKAPPSVLDDDPAANLVILDDAGNGFRDLQGLWPAALTGRSNPIIVYKARRPLLAGQLWAHLQSRHLKRTIAVLNADELRENGAPISRHLSWERTATDLVLVLEHEPAWQALRSCPHVIVPFGQEGVVHLQHLDGKISAYLWYVADLQENDLVTQASGFMLGASSVFTAALAAFVATTPVGHQLTSETISTAIRQGLVAARYLLDFAFGDCKDQAGARQHPKYPGADVFQHDEFPEFVIQNVELPTLPLRRDSAGINEYRGWQILHQVPPRDIHRLAAEIAVKGLKKALPDLPVARFGKVETIDRDEIESYRRIRNLIREFLKNPRPERPLCLAVFGRPGSGKSFGVTEVAKSVDDQKLVEKIDFNLSQWESPADLAVALHRVRDVSLRGNVPLVFFDEFDSSVGGNSLHWLKYFLAPMQDGVFVDGNLTHQIGRAIFVFAGGTCEKFEDFSRSTQSVKPDVKLPDFLSRLRGRVDIFGTDPLGNARIMQRAIILRSIFARKFPAFFDANEVLRIHPSVLSAFLNVPEYRHGLRSLEAVLDMSQLHGREVFDPSLLPPLEQLELHVNGRAFARIVESPLVLGRYLEPLAKAIHERYLQGVQRRLDRAVNKQGKKKISDRPSARDWDHLSELYRDSNREQAAHIPIKLDAINCELVPLKDGETAPLFTFAPGEIDWLAELEHERWDEERRKPEPLHAARVPWNELPQADRDKAIASVEDIPKLLADCQLRIKRR